MSVQITVYVCVITHNENMNINILTAVSYQELLQKVIENILDCGEDYPNLSQFNVLNSMEFINEYDEEDYQELLQKIICYLSSEGFPYQIRNFELEQVIDKEKVISIESVLI